MLTAFQKLSPQRQEAILDAAAEVFAEMGYYGANIQAICARAGISVGGLYKYFRNKEALFRTMLEHGLDLMQRFYGKAFPVPGTFYESFAAMLGQLPAISRAYRPYFIIYIDIGSFCMNVFADEIVDRFESISRDFFFFLIDKGKRQGEIDPRINNQHAALLLSSYLTMFVYALVSEHHRQRFDLFFKTGERQFTDEERIGLIIESLRAFLGVHSPLPA